MVAQYTIAGIAAGIVIGTDDAAEALMGFYTKFGDGAADVLPLAGLNKRRVRAMAAALGAPEHLVWKVPTADLESDAPLRPELTDSPTSKLTTSWKDGRLNRERKRGSWPPYSASAHKRVLPVPVG